MGPTQHEYNRMPFGLNNAPPYFQATMMRVLTGLIGVVCSIYIDDIIIFAKTLPELAMSLLAVLTRLREYNFKVNLEKSVIGAKEVEFLCTIVSGIRRSPKKFEALKHFKRIEGSMNYLKRYIPYYAEVAKPITKMLETPKRSFHWGPKQEEAANRITAALEANTCLEHACPNRELHLFTDASIVGIGGVPM
ncbi:enzymatic polyprotein endonuclease reverse [Aduncisulcus paluster]|uniref:Enzymatic polyprotein endonuclease reverse n=1 Tax=Aduncisulcus paluster TaxID=2918883 RepID=A0ABQ5K086_9EUKA|nr:enzymatic polyprotein endonuclease reverse [Aduncisulcus paluster]